MLSVILYGRNDDHGYNYHKRIATSLNAIAETLSDPHDEILYTDYNSPEDFPTLIEAIGDTLTERAHQLIRVFRVRAPIHRRFISRTPLPVLEPIARNVALRRSNPHNKWVLSTNADMVFVPRQEGDSLTRIVSDLPDGFYGLPRFELPEQLWEIQLDRMDPHKNISFLRATASSFRWDTIVRVDNFLRYDNPGDFQLFLRKDLFALRGFDEEMLHGWHLDANLAKRASLILSPGPSLEQQLMAFHCNHTCKASLLHEKGHWENDWKRFVDNPHLLPYSNAENWGLGEDIIEEIRIKKTPHPHIVALTHALSSASKSPTELKMGSGHYNRLTYSPSRIFPFLVDHFSHIAKSSQVAYFGFNPSLITLLQNYLKENGFPTTLLSPHPLPSLSLTSWEQIAERASVLIFDFGFDQDAEIGRSIQASTSGYRHGKRQIKRVLDDFCTLLQHKTLLQPRTKWIGINVTQTDIQPIFNRHLVTRMNALITGISYGYLSSKIKKRKPNLRSLKKQLHPLAHYVLARYFFLHIDNVRTYLSHSIIGKLIKKKIH